jgi:hypothetical protein
MVEAYSRLDYDLGILAPGDEKVLQAKGLEPPEGWIRASDDAQTLTYRIKGSTLGVVVFPAALNPDQSWIDKASDRVRKACRKLGPDCELVAGVSTWGYSREKRFLLQGAPSLDILLGGGKGRNVRGKALGGTLWIRPYGRGKVVHGVTVPQWGKGAGSGDAGPASRFRTRMKVLRERIAPDPEIADLLR